MKKSIANITRAAILGLLTLGIFAGCAEILGGPPSGIQEDGPAAGKGRVLISLGPRAEGARTFIPDVAYENFSYTYEFIAEGKDPVSGTITGGNAVVEMATGTWDLAVYGLDAGNPVLKGTVENIKVNAEKSTLVQVLMKAFTENGVMGDLNYSVTFPDDVIKGTLTVYPWDGDENQGMSLDPTTASYPGSDPDTKTVSGTGSLLAGYHRLAITLYRADGVFSQTDIAHVYPGLTTNVLYTITAADFTPATVDTAGFTTLADALDDINTLSPSDHKV
jgi:hypothetical protein